MALGHEYSAEIGYSLLLPHSHYVSCETWMRLREIFGRENAHKCFPSPVSLAWKELPSSLQHC